MRFSSALGLPGAVNTTLPLAMNVSTSVKPSAANSFASRGIGTTCPPTLMALRNATWRAMAAETSLRYPRPSMGFRLQSPYPPAGDQPQAIDELVAGLRAGEKHQTLLGVTGSGKTYTIANVVEEWGRPALV